MRYPLALALMSPITLRPSWYGINPVDLREVTVRDKFWAQRLETNAKVTLYHELDELQGCGRRAKRKVERARIRRLGRLQGDRSERV